MPHKDKDFSNSILPLSLAKRRKARKIRLFTYQFGYRYTDIQRHSKNISIQCNISANLIWLLVLFMRICFDETNQKIFNFSGWNLVLEYIIGTASVARGLSGYLDELMNKQMSNFFCELHTINIPYLAQCPDFFGFSVVMILSFLLSAGVKESSILNNLFTAINVSTVILVIISGIIKGIQLLRNHLDPEPIKWKPMFRLLADVSNWKIRKEDIPAHMEGGEGGFMPFGIAGVMAGAAKCFYGFVGFDVLATTGEEAINPKRNIPLSIVLSLIIIFFSYFGISTVLTMMWPYYELVIQSPKNIPTQF